MQTETASSAGSFRPRPNLDAIAYSLVALAVFLTFCVSDCPAQSTVVVGVGSTVPLHLYTVWADAYNKRNPKFQMRYLPLGTAEGIKLVGEGSGDFGTGEVVPDNDRAIGKLTALPTALVAIVPIYNLPGNPELRFTGELLAEIFLGRIKTWNSPAISKLNPAVSLPGLPIRVLNRRPGKGSNFIFSDFLSKASSQFRSEVGVSASPKWPVGDSTERSQDMVTQVKEEPGSIGYVELQYAVESQVRYGSVQNPSGRFVEASAQSISAACQAAESPHWDRFSISLTHAEGPDSYPITSFTWIYVPSESKHDAALADFLNWAFGEGQAAVVSSGYSPLPPQLLQKVQAKVSGLR